MLVGFYAHIELRINNTYFRHKTFNGSRDRTTTLEYIITNDVRVLTYANLGSDHGLVLGKINIK